MARRGRADPIPVPQHVVGDLEHGERGDAGGQPRETHERDADEERVQPADDRGDDERKSIPDLRSGDPRKEIRADRGQLQLLRERGERRREPADGDEADVPERQDAGVAGEHVEGDHHRGRDDRGAELEGRVRGRERAGQADGGDQRHRSHELAQAESPRRQRPHTRSTAAPRREKRPSGRRSRTRMTSAKTSDVR